jgi:hypothetical protein
MAFDPSNLVDWHRRFKGTCFLQRPGNRKFLNDYMPIEMEARVFNREQIQYIIPVLYVWHCSLSKTHLIFETLRIWVYRLLYAD